MSTPQSGRDQVRVGIIGCGSITRHRHAPELAANPEAEIVAFADRFLERAEKCAAKFGGEAVPHWEDLIARDDIQAIFVDTSNVSHAAITIAALQSGKHVLCEKPMATSDEEARAMIAAAAQADRYLMIGHNQRLAPLHVKAKQVFDAGVIGKLVTFRTSFSHPGPESWSIEGAAGWFFDKKQAFVGSMGDLGIHKADLLLWLIGEDIIEASAFVEQIAKPQGDVDDNAVCLLRARSGAVGTLTASWTHSPGEDNGTILYGTKGILRIGTERSFPLVVNLMTGENQYFETGRIQSNEAGGQSDSGVSRAFIRAITTGTPPEIDGEQGRRALAVILACLESAETKRHVAVRL
jgi:UDP-N-acetylglucosamine 3-dehydrogenase